ncbi:DUF551 domain-containing protein [Escherichia coli]
MTTITKERIELFIKNPLENGLARGEQMELAQIALASLAAEPMAWKWRLTSLFDGVQIGPWRVCLAPLSPGKGDGCKTEAIPLYTAPPVPVVPAALPENDDEDGHDIDYLEPSEVYALGRTSGWNACRAAMLHSAKPVSQTYKLTFEQWLEQQHDKIDVDCGCVSTEMLMHWIRVAYEAGNYPVTPDGWISCSERMPDDGQHVIILCDGAFVLYAQYRDGEFFDVVRNGEEFFETQSRNVTHWMPLPEPPL